MRAPSVRYYHKMTTHMNGKVEKQFLSFQINKGWLITWFAHMIK